MMTYEYLMNNLGCAEDGYKALYTEIMGTEYAGDPLILKESVDWCLSGLIDWKYLNKNAKRISQRGITNEDRERLEVPYKDIIFLRYGLDGKTIRDFTTLAKYVLTKQNMYSQIHSGNIGVAHQIKCRGGLNVVLRY